MLPVHHRYAIKNGWRLEDTEIEGDGRPQVSRTPLPERKTYFFRAVNRRTKETREFSMTTNDPAMEYGAEEEKIVFRAELAVKYARENGWAEDGCDVYGDGNPPIKRPSLPERATYHFTAINTRTGERIQFSMNTNDAAMAYGSEPEKIAFKRDTAEKYAASRGWAVEDTKIEGDGSKPPGHMDSPLEYHFRAVNTLTGETMGFSTTTTDPAHQFGTEDQKAEFLRNLTVEFARDTDGWSAEHTRIEPDGLPGEERPVELPRKYRVVATNTVTQEREFFQAETSDPNAHGTEAQQAMYLRNLQCVIVLFACLVAWTLFYLPVVWCGFAGSLHELSLIHI